MTLQKGQDNANSARPAPAQPSGARNEVKDDVQARRPATTGTRRSTSTQRLPKAQPANRGRAVKGQGYKDSAAQARRDWRTSAWSTFILGLVLVEGVAQLVTANWKVSIAFAGGMVYAAVMWPGGER